MNKVSKTLALLAVVLMTVSLLLWKTMPSLALVILFPATEEGLLVYR